MNIQSSKSFQSATTTSSPFPFQQPAGVKSLSEPGSTHMSGTLVQEAFVSDAGSKKPVPAHALPRVSAAIVAKASGKPDLALQEKIVQIVGAIESKNNYSAINTNPSGGGIAYGTLQVLSRTGGLHQLLQQYSVAGGKFAPQLMAFGNSSSANVANQKEFQQWLKKAGNDPIMQQVQRRFFAQNYLQPAISFGQENKLTLPASYLILFDAFIHYGTDKAWLRQKITTLVQKHGEAKGMKAFLKWMRNSLHQSYARRYGTQSIQAQYNVWRADFLYSLLRENRHLQGNIKVQAPQWRHPLHIK